MKLIRTVTAKMTFIEEAPEGTSIEDIKTPEQHAQDIMEVLADEFAPLGVFSYEIKDIETRIED